jgi:hypothetical protein
MGFFGEILLLNALDGGYMFIGLLFLRIRE